MWQVWKSLTDLLAILLRALGAPLLVDVLSGWLARRFLFSGGGDLLPEPNQKSQSLSSLSESSLVEGLLGGTYLETKLTLDVVGKWSHSCINGLWDIFNILTEKSKSKFVRSSHLKQLLLALCGRPKLETIAATALEFQQTKGRFNRLLLALSLSL